MLLPLLLGFFFLHHLGAMPLQEPDEGRYGDIASTMLRTGDWITPRLDAIRYYEKPPLFFWFAATSMGALGVSALALRLPSAIAALLTTLLVLHWGRRALSLRAGKLAAITLATMPLFAVLSRAGLVDVVLTLFTTIALYAADRALLEPAPQEPARMRWILALWISMGLATLVKGPIGIALPLASILAALAGLRAWKRLRGLFAPAGLAALALVVLPWNLVMEWRNPGYLRDFLIGQNWARLTSGAVFHRHQPWWFYPAILLGTLLPWSLFLVPALGCLLRRLTAASPWASPPRPAPSRSTRHLTLLLAAVAVPFGILSAAHSKLAYYILPLLPPLAILIGRALYQDEDAARSSFQRRFLGISIGCLGMIALTIAAVLGGVLAWRGGGGLGGVIEDAAGRWNFTLRDDWIRAITGVAPAALAGTAMVAAAALAAAWCCWRGSLARAGFVLAAGLSTVLVAAPHLIARYAPPQTFPAAGVAALVREHARPGENIVLYRHYLRGLPFCLQEPVILWDAGFDEFGHEMTEGEARGKALQKHGEELDRLLATGGDSLLVLAEDDARASLLRRRYPGEVELLGRAVPSYELLRVHAHRASMPPPQTDPTQRVPLDPHR